MSLPAEGQVITACGPVEAASLGRVLMHEHLHSDIFDWDRDEPILEEAPIQPELHQAPEALPVVRKGLGQRLLVAGAKALSQFLVVAARRGHSYSYLMLRRNGKTSPLSTAGGQTGISNARRGIGGRLEGDRGLKTGPCGGRDGALCVISRRAERWFPALSGKE